MKPLKSQNFYEILGVARYATHEEIRNAHELARHTYKENSLATYSLFSDEENSEILRMITEAYQTLYNPELRRQYDDGLLAEERRLAGGGVASGERPAARAASGGGRARPAAAPRNLPRRSPPTAERERSSQQDPPGLVAREATLREPAALGPRSESAPSSDAGAMAVYVDSVERFNGAVLRQVRLKAGIELGDLAEITKIRRAYLQYLEEENFEFLPAPVYIKGFITIIAKTLSLPPERVAQEYMEGIPGHGNKK